ncbi:MAG: hypothetical protein PHX83_04180 [Acidobacteriia bacterium]|nr:hypothetical protein [Terriglobia bacterium]
MGTLSMSKIVEVTPINFPVMWGEESLAKVRAAHLGAFMERLWNAQGGSETYLGIKLARSDAAGLAGSIPIQFRCGAVTVPSGTLLIFGIRFLDRPEDPLDSEHLIDPTNEKHLDHLGLMLSQNRWLLPVFDEVGQLVVVKFMRSNPDLKAGYECVRQAAVLELKENTQNWTTCQIEYDRLFRPGHLFLQSNPEPVTASGTH